MSNRGDLNDMDMSGNRTQGAGGAGAFAGGKARRGGGAPWLRWAVPLALGAGLILCFPQQAGLAARLALGGWAAAFCMEPLAVRLSRRLGEKRGALAAAALWGAAALAGLAALAPPIAAQLADLARGIPLLTQWGLELLERVNRYLSQLGLPALEAGRLASGALEGGWVGQGAARMLSGTAWAAGAVVQGLGQLGLALMLGVYFLMDKKRLALRLEWMIPARVRPLALRMASEAGRGLRAYLRGQALVAGLVGALSALGLWAAGLRSPLALGMLVGLCNLIPYFGPVLGGVPVALSALAQGPWTVLFALAVLLLVQQLDALLISPRVMSGVTGLSPAAVLLGLAVGGSGWGVAGMLLALPALAVARICFRVWASRQEAAEQPRP